MENAIEKKSWTWALLGDVMIMTDKAMGEHSFNIADITDPETKRLLYYYGVKQFITDRFSSEKDETEKIRLMHEFLAEIVEKGLEIAGKGQIVVKGRERANRKTDTWECDSLPKLSTYSVEDLRFLLKAHDMGIRKLSTTFMDAVKTEIETRETNA